MCIHLNVTCAIQYVHLVVVFGMCRHHSVNCSLVSGSHMVINTSLDSNGSVRHMVITIHLTAMVQVAYGNNNSLDCNGSGSHMVITIHLTAMFLMAMLN